MLAPLYEMWQWVIAASTVIGVISVLVAFWKFINKDSSQNKFVRFLGNAFAIAAGVIICLSCVVGMMFTEVPRVHGWTVNEAEAKLQEAGLKIGYQPGVIREENWSSKVIGQSIDEGSIVQKDTKVIVYLNVTQISPPDIYGMVSVPNVVGMEQIEATELLIESGLQFQVWWTEDNNVDSEQYFIIQQSIPADSKVTAGTLIKLELSPNKP